MQFDSLSAFLDMGGYGFYVWLSFGLSAILLLSLIYSSIRGHKKTLTNIASHQIKENRLHQLRKQRNETKIKKTKEVT